MRSFQAATLRDGALRAADFVGRSLVCIKHTAARTFVSSARRASVAAAVQAGRIMLGEIERHFLARVSFAFETTLAGRTYLRHIERWRRAGFYVELIFLRLGSPEEAMARVEERVRQGGHSIPSATIRRRYHAGLHNFEHKYALAVDTWTLYDNSGEEPVLLDWRVN